MLFTEHNTPLYKVNCPAYHIFTHVGNNVRRT